MSGTLKELDGGLIGTATRISGGILKKGFTDRVDTTVASGSDWFEFNYNNGSPRNITISSVDGATAIISEENYAKYLISGSTEDLKVGSSLYLGGEVNLSGAIAVRDADGDIVGLTYTVADAFLVGSDGVQFGVFGTADTAYNISFG
jgi:hypothetical protein